MDSFELNKIAAAILIALLTVKGADLISNALIHPQMLTENAFKIEGVSSTSTAGPSAEKTGPAPIEPLLAKANAENGAHIFKKCTSCHTAEKGGPNKIGPDLYGVVGAEKGKHPGYTYSQAMEKKGGTWTYADLNHFIYSPREFIPGTKMSFAGLKNDQERADVIAYLRQQNDHPVPLPEVKTEAKKPEEGKPSVAAKDDKSAAKPQAGKPAAKPEEGKPAEKPETAKPTEKAETKPATQQETAKPSTPSEANPTVAPKPEEKPKDEKSAAKPEAGKPAEKAEESKGAAKTKEGMPAEKSETVKPAAKTTPEATKQPAEAPTSQKNP